MNFPDVIEIDIIQEDIDKAFSFKPFEGSWASTCPVSQALIRQGFADVCTTAFDFIFITDPKNFKSWKKYEMSSSLKEYVSNVDHAHSLNPTHKRKATPVTPAKFMVKAML